MTTALKFRNLTASADDPVETWPFEGILAAVERGTLPDWRRLAKVVQADPWAQWPSKFSRRSTLPGHMAPPNYWKEPSGAPASLLQIQSATKWPPRCEGLLVTPACPGKTSLTG